ncbi:MAG: hypothetical protein ABII13_00595 [Patescibacteria group bacterium]|nr:hypothetical protein [Patescibacteria group bacterium]MBU2508784.1 hypothetical protein [Patescibacteria group bacterium]
MVAPIETQQTTTPKQEVLCSITTAGDSSAQSMNWRLAIPATFDLGMDRFSVFLTMLGPKERLEFYQLLRDRSSKNQITIPFVHARSDMLPDEYKMFMSEFGTERFNLHPVRKTPLPDCGLPDDLREIIYIENVGKLLESDLIGFAGLCLDISHLEITRKAYPDYFPELCRLAKTYTIGASHISAFEQTASLDKHSYSSLSEFEYLYHFPLSFFGKYVAIELSNKLSEQLPVKELVEQYIGINQN